MGSGAGSNIATGPLPWKGEVAPHDSWAWSGIIRRQTVVEEVIPYAGAEVPLRPELLSRVADLYEGVLRLRHHTATARLLTPGSYAVDVGANMGAYTLLMAECVGPKGRVASFEPNPEVFKRLLYNLELNQLSPRVMPIPSLSPQLLAQQSSISSVECRNRAVASMRAYSEGHDQAIEVDMDVLDHALHSGHADF